MATVIFLMILSAFFFLAFLMALLSGASGGKQRHVHAGLGSLMLFLCLLGYTFYVITHRSYERLGEEIYASLFGIPKYNCVDIKHSQDKIVPMLDYAVWINFECCPRELARILSQHRYTTQKISRENIKDYLNRSGVDWFRPQLLGDTIMIYQYNKDRRGKIQMIYTNISETEVYCIDM